MVKFALGTRKKRIQTGFMEKFSGKRRNGELTSVSGVIRKKRVMVHGHIIGVLWSYMENEGGSGKSFCEPYTTKTGTAQHLF